MPKEMIVRRRLLGSAAVLALASVVAAGAASAQQSSGEQEGTTEAELPAVNVETEDEAYRRTKASSPKLTEPLRDTPATINVVPKEVIEDQGATTLRDVLRNVPGVSIAAGEGGGAQGDNLRIRGFAANTDLFVDGMRDIAQYGRDPFNLEQVEVAKGASSAYAGRGSTGGTVNLVSKTPQLDEFILGTGSFGTDETFRGTIDMNKELDDIGIAGTAFRLNVMGHESEVAGRDIVENERWGIAPSLSFGLDTQTEVWLSYFHLSQDNIPDYGHPFDPVTGRPVNVRQENFYGFKSLNTEQTEGDAFTGRILHHFTDDVTLRNQTRYSEDERFAIVSPPRFPTSGACVASVATDTVCRNFAGRDTNIEFLINQTDLTADFMTGAIEHTLVIGLEASHEDFDNQALTFTPSSIIDDLTTPNPFATYPGVITNGTRTLTEADSLAVYAFDTITLDEHWELSAGVRWDRFDASVDSIPAVGPAVHLSRVDEFTSVKGGIVYKPIEEASIYVSYATSFNPSAEALALSTGATGTANVGPEENETFEIGAKWDVLDERLSLAAALFRIDKTNARTEDPANPGDFLVLEGEQRVDGFELSASGSITDELQIFAGYTYLDSEVRESRNPLEVGNEIPNVPEQTFNVWMTYDVTDRLQLGGGVQFLDDRFSNNVNTNVAPSYWVVDAMARYQLQEHIAVRVNLYNMGDEFYYDRVNPAHTVPGAGRSVLISFDVSF
jgi:catecholate siderophore receptor